MEPTSDTNKEMMDAMKFCTAYRTLCDALNPEWSQSAAQNIFRGSAVIENLLQNFEIHQATYAIVGPDTDVCPAAMRRIIENELRREVNVALKLDMVIPKSLVKVSSPTFVRIAIRFHGGGGMTGHPRFPDWECRADLEWLLQAPNTISIDPTYCLMPEASGSTILGNITSICAFLFDDLEPTLKRINPHFAIAWDHFYIFGISFGGWMALALYLNLGNWKPKPPTFYIRALLLTCPHVKEYRREAGYYMGVPISKHQVDEDCEKIYSIVRQMSFQLHRAGSYPPEGMYGAYAFSVGKRYGDIWEEKTVFNMIEEAKECPDSRTKVRIDHGTRDIQVPHASSEDLCALFLQKGWPEIDLKLHEDKSHAWNSADALTDSVLNFLNQSST